MQDGQETDENKQTLLKRYVGDGSRSLFGKPVERAQTGGWRAAPFIYGNNQTEFAHCAVSRPLQAALSLISTSKPREIVECSMKREYFGPNCWEVKLIKKTKKKLLGSSDKFALAVLIFADTVSVLGIAGNLVPYAFGTLHLSVAESANAVTNFMGLTYLLPLVWGFLADSYIGRFWIIAFTSISSLAVRPLHWIPKILNHPAEFSGLAICTECHIASLPFPHIHGEWKAVSCEYFRSSSDMIEMEKWYSVVSSLGLGSNQKP